MKAEIFMGTERLAYLMKEMQDKVQLVGEVDEKTDQQKITIEITNDIDLLLIFHAGVRYGLDRMHDVFQPK